MKERRNKLDDKEDKTLPPHNFITLELVRRKFITDDSDFELYLWDALFQEMFQRFEFKVVLICTGYTISCIKRNHFKDENGNGIDCLFAYFKVALYHNIHKYTTPVHIDWMDDDWWISFICCKTSFLMS